MRTAARMLGSDPRIDVAGLSSRYVTPPLGPAQPDFVNAAVLLESELAPRALLAELQRVEASLGRVRKVRWGPRTIDLDLLWWEGGEVRDPDLTVPHPGLRERGFALAPLLEVAPDLQTLLGADLARVGAPSGGPWTKVERSEDAIEAVALDDADALALALSEALGEGTSSEVVLLGEPAPALVERAGRAGQRASIVIEAVEPGVIRARMTSDPRAARAAVRLALSSLGAGRCRLALDPAKP